MSAFSGTYVEAVRQALFDAMEADDRVCCLGEDIGVYGGAFRATEGLLARFGADRVIDTPISEQAIAGAAIGAALMGQKAVAEFQFMDFALLASDLMVNFAAKAHWRWGASVPAVFRGPSGGGNGGGPFHSQNPEGHFLGSPGLKVVAPGTVRDAYALLRAAIDDPDPVLVFEHKHLYRRLKDQWDEAPTARLGEAALRKDGASACIITYGAAQHVALEAVEGLDVAVLDLRTLWPLDDAAIAGLAQRTHRVLVLTEAPATYGPGAELAARIGETCFSWLDAPVCRVGATDTPTPASPPLEAACLPSAARVRVEVERLLAW
ncbi:2-oxoisovalerate dehydrogenase subunit beta [Geothrix limicola]|uniref:2-oxoisovalerate dehydrogenase subunit beta n=1 Tax=Geothrix limicola TaxID=2927978 RepID=A0ABQ5QE39_9BACT|nr:transketolase C-terminal domain-containing protein [Geothrix limicola]GLH72927.1 2-oxoisovalerate dehydrogenase subunit beta [Geothrix limicola]